MIPRRTAARSEIKNQCFSASAVNISGLFQPKYVPPDKTGSPFIPIGITSGDCEGPTHEPFLYKIVDIYRTSPAAIILIATPETTWSTPNVIVAIA
ncbi:unannotated protein [freshwater metagenome]|uniref:Unannotated protein n=1 Tax=freshwater metagenome TaxID=449393 RepID=A0A6J6RZV4_9ZZZZ